MFENFKSITIEGGYFENPTTLNLFKKSHLSIIYGRNGSGKTTIAKSIRQLVGKDTEQPNEDGYTAFSVSSDSVIPEDKKDSVFIFDEEFVRLNVRTQGKGLETIVMMGEQVDLDTQMAKKKEEKVETEKKLQEFLNLKAKFEDSSDTSSPQYFYNKIRESLREDGGWADIDRDVKGNSVKGRITEELINRLVSMEEPKESKEELRIQLSSDLSLYTQTEDAQILGWKAGELVVPANLDEIKNLLEIKVERPELSDREQRLLHFLQEHAGYYSQQTTRLLTEEQWQFCPLCLRSIEENDYTNISEILQHMLNKESERYSSDLDKAMESFIEVKIDFSEFPDKLNKNERLAVHVAAEQLNKDIGVVREKISRRKNDIYSIVNDSFSPEELNAYVEHLITYQNAIKALEKCVEKYNRSVNERAKLKKQVQHENDLLARKRLTTILKGYKQAKKAHEACKTEISTIEQDKERIEGEIKAIKAQIERTDIALEYINEELQYVFYSDKKVRLAAGDGYYKLMINGRNVPPKKISVGERNVLGLCYFFAKLFSNKKKEDKYNDETLLVIDDPVSSFDYGNRLGVMSLLRYQFSNIKKGNPNSKMLVLTHDLRSAFDLAKIRSELNGGKRERGEKLFLELVDKQLKQRAVSNEYKNLLEYVYEYAKKPANDADEHIETGIGNVMRRVVEAFSSFCYNMPFEEMMCRDVILKAIPEKKRKYYENFMCRHTLNGESHMEERVYDLNTITPFFTEQEKIQTAKSLLLFLKYVNEEHLACYLGKNTDDEEDKMAEINSWEIEEANWLI